MNSNALGNLRIIAILHYVLGGLRLLVSCAGLIYIVVGLVLLGTAAGERSHDDKAAAGIAGGVLLLIGAIVVLVGLVYAGLTIYAGRCIDRRVHRTFSYMMAIFNCLMFPFGLALGVFTLIHLSKDEVKAEYERKRLGTA